MLVVQLAQALLLAESVELGRITAAARWSAGLVNIKLPSWEPPIGIEPMTYALRVRRSDRLS
jgi:hypothetical protein